MNGPIEEIALLVGAATGDTVLDRRARAISSSAMLAAMAAATAAARGPRCG